MESQDTKYIYIYFFLIYIYVFFIIPGSNDAEKSPSDEGFTELEPTVNAEEMEGSASITLSIVNGDQQAPEPGRTGSVDLEGRSILSHTKGKLDEEEDEGVAQNSSIEDGESLQSSTEAEKQGDEIVVSRGASDAREPERRSGKSSPMEVPQGRGNHLERPAGGAGLAEEEERRKASYEAEMKSWLLERMQAPIEGRSSSSSSSETACTLSSHINLPLFTSNPRRHAALVRGEEQTPAHVPVLQGGQTHEEVLHSRPALQSHPPAGGPGEAARVLVCHPTGEVRQHVLGIK